MIKIQIRLWREEYDGDDKISDREQLFANAGDDAKQWMDDQYADLVEEEGKAEAAQDLAEDLAQEQE